MTFMIYDRPRSREPVARRAAYVARIRGEEFLHVDYSGPDAHQAFEQDFDQFSANRDPNAVQLFGYHDSPYGLLALIFHDAKRIDARLWPPRKLHSGDQFDFESHSERDHIFEAGSSTTCWEIKLILSMQLEFYGLAIPQFSVQTFEYETGAAALRLLESVPVFLYNQLLLLASSLDLSAVEILLLLAYHSFEPQIIHFISGTPLHQLLLH
ncbi:hypothetical protein Moror_4851 [Moniliophthora roreri MCA 2997]|uniref:Uncharacterized protein n=1 Tax=Moniliophthora roreri (strain MCA 2997) TaxID=1381753 RepID=V2WTH5_MONRO|nr:hypothetical protein Moror_4851 [Moniliophthora roreri MCA 2997]